MSGANITEMVEDHQAKPLYNYEALTMLTIKNPDNKMDKEELMRVLYHLKSIVGFSTILYCWYENGKQGQQHIHSIILKKMPRQEEIKKMSKSFKQKKLRYLRYFAEAEDHNIWGLGDMVTYEVDTSKINWMLSSFENQSHLAEVIHEYRFKELDPDFIDD